MGMVALTKRYEAHDGSTANACIMDISTVFGGTFAGTAGLLDVEPGSRYADGRPNL